MNLNLAKIPDAILLLGPTGSGKTPLGELLEQEGLLGRRCLHFDFGAQLRKVVAQPTGVISSSELEIVRNSLTNGTLLTDGQFTIAEKLLGSFIENNRTATSDLIILNGLPRHEGQAAALEPLIKIKAVIVLECDAATVLQRIRTDAGGDRGSRIDDNIEDVKRKLVVFNEKTLPLIRYYDARAVSIIRITVGACGSALDSFETLTGKMDHIVEKP